MAEEDTGFDAVEWGRYVTAAAEQVEDAAALAETGSYDSAVLHLEQATQLVLKGLLRGAGMASSTFIHGLRTLAERCAEHLGMEIDEAELADLKRLEREYQPTRYPDALVEGTPRGAYSRRDYERAERTYATTRSRVETAWEALNAAARDTEEPPP